MGFLHNTGERMALKQILCLLLSMTRIDRYVMASFWDILSSATLVWVKWEIDARSVFEGYSDLFFTYE